ncbi:MAG: hypothetical protein QM687_17230 [Ferruginibacter sp.]
MTILKILLFFMTFSSCSTTKNQKIVIIGQAENAKAGAVVKSEKDKKIYYLEAIDYWDEAIVGKTVKVSGTLIVETKMQQNADEEIKQEIVGEKRIIQKPKWVLIK